MEEIEEKFYIDRIKYIPHNLKFLDYKRIDQKYLAINENSELRLRRTLIDNTTDYELTYKLGTGKVRKEETLKIDNKTGNILYENIDHIPISKKRYEIEYKDKIIELDVFLSPDDLILAEIEFETVDEMFGFDYPDWFGANIGMKNVDIYKELNGLD